MPTEQQPKQSFMNREISRRGIFIIYLVIGLFTVAPILSFAIAGGVARFCGCQVDESGVHPCIILGTDVGGLLYDMCVAGWFALLTVPFGLLVILLITLDLVKGRKRNVA